MKPCKSADYFTKVSFHIVVDMSQGESNIFQISTWKAFLLLKIYLLWKIRPISVKGWKPVWIRACPIVLLMNLQQLDIVRLNVGTSVFITCIWIQSASTGTTFGLTAVIILAWTPKICLECSLCCNQSQVRSSHHGNHRQRTVSDRSWNKLFSFYKYKLPYCPRRVTEEAP